MSSYLTNTVLDTIFINFPSCNFSYVTCVYLMFKLCLNFYIEISKESINFVSLKIHFISDSQWLHYHNAHALFFDTCNKLIFTISFTLESNFMLIIKIKTVTLWSFWHATEIRNNLKNKPIALCPLTKSQTL